MHVQVHMLHIHTLTPAQTIESRPQSLRAPQCDIGCPRRAPLRCRRAPRPASPRRAHRRRPPLCAPRPAQAPWCATAHQRVVEFNNGASKPCCVARTTSRGVNGSPPWLCERRPASHAHDGSFAGTWQAICRLACRWLPGEPARESACRWQIH